MTTHGAKTALELALDAFHAEQNKREQEQLDLFTAPAGDQSPVAANGNDAARNQPVHVARLGRPLGARNRRTDAMANYYIQRNSGRDPLERGIEIGGLPILAPGVLEALAERLGCSRFEAAKWWSGNLATILPFCHQKQASLEVKPVGSPGGEPVSWSFTDDGAIELTGDDVSTLDQLADVLIDVTPSARQ